MVIVVLGAPGTIGSAVVRQLGVNHDVVGVSRRTNPSVDLADRASIRNVFDLMSDVDAVVCCAANAPLMALSEDGFVPGLRPKLFGQVELAPIAVEHLRDWRSVTLTSGAIPDGLAGSASGALVNAGLEASVRPAATAKRSKATTTGRSSRCSPRIAPTARRTHSPVSVPLLCP